MSDSEPTVQEQLDALAARISDLEGLQEVSDEDETERLDYEHRAAFQQEESQKQWEAAVRQHARQREDATVVFLRLEQKVNDQQREIDSLTRY